VTSHPPRTHSIMRIAIIGRTEILYETVGLLTGRGHEIGLTLTAKESPEYTKGSDDFRALAKELGIPFVHTAKIDEQTDFIRSLPPMEIGVSLNYSGIISQRVIDLFPLGILNAHGGDLPRYRGNACQAWAILNQENRIGLCIHRMIGGELDSGDIVCREYLPIDLNTKVTAAYNWMAECIPPLFLDAIERLSANPSYVLEIQSKDSADALRCYPRRPEDGRIDWTRTAEDILRLINASNRPFSGAFCELEEKRVVIWDAVLGPPENFLAVPGQITALCDEFLEVATGRGKLRLRELECDGCQIAPRILCRSVRQRLD